MNYSAVTAITLGTLTAAWFLMTVPIVPLPYPFNGDVDLPSPVSLVRSLAGNKTEKVVSSVCTPTIVSDLDDGFISGFLMSVGLPRGATVESEVSLGNPQHPSKTIIKYRGQIHAVNVRQDGTGACFDFTPPIPVN
jgi:hypothetical protein